MDIAPACHNLPLCMPLMHARLMLRGEFGTMPA